MPDTCPVVRVADPKAPGGFVEINEEDYDEKKHKLYDESSPEPNPELRGKLPEGFPGKAAFEAAGFTTYAKVRAAVAKGERVSGVADATLAKVKEALAAKPESEDEG